MSPFARLRDRLLTSARFRSWAMAFPLTRPLARRQARALFDLCAGFVYSQILHACVQLRLFEHLAAGPASTDALAGAMDLTAEAAERLLRGAAALGLVERRGADDWGLGMLGASLIEAPGIEAMIRHHAVLYEDLADPVALLRGEHAPALAEYWGYSGNAAPGTLEPEKISPYSALMTASNAMVAEQIIAAYPFARHRRLLDLGGGEGGFLLEVARAAPALQLQMMDLPAVAASAERRLAAAGLASRAEVFPGSFFTDPLPAGADLITLVRILHDHDDDKVRLLLARAHEALAPGGTLLVAEPMAETPGAEPVGDAYFGFYLLAMRSGRPRRVDELKAMLAEAGFTDIRRRGTALPLQAGLLTAARKKDVNLS